MIGVHVGSASWHMRLDDACSILGCDKRCTFEDAQKKYRRLALTHHPDRCPDDERATAKFQTIGEAWSRFQRWKSDGFDDPAYDDGCYEQATADPRTSSWWSSSGFSSWFGVGGGGGGFAEPTRCGENCDCNFCRIEKRRAERRAKADEEAAAKKRRDTKRWEEELVRKQKAAAAWKEQNAMERAAEAEALEQQARARAEEAAAAAAAAEAKAEQERADAAERKRVREKEAKAMRKLRARLRGACQAHPLLVDEASLALLCTQLEQVALSKLCLDVEQAPDLDGAGGVVQAAIAECRVLQAQQQQVAAAAMASAAAAAAAIEGRKADWTPQENELLTKGMIKFPSGVPERWEKVAEFINHLATFSHARTADDTTRRVKDMRKELERQRDGARPRLHVSTNAKESNNTAAAARPAAVQAPAQVSRKAPAPAPATPSITSKQGPLSNAAPALEVQSMVATAAAPVPASKVPPGPPVPVPTPPSLPPAAMLPPGLGLAAAATRPPSATTLQPPPPLPAVAPAAVLEWSSSQQKALELALQQFPASLGSERWERIAESVSGKTKAECIKRFKEIVAALKVKKTKGKAQTAVT